MDHHVVQVASSLETAIEAWKAAGDAIAFRRALLRVLAELEQL